MPHNNLVVELLNRLLNWKIKAVQRTNRIQARKFYDMLENALNK